MRLWDVETGRCLRQFDGQQARCVAWSEDETQALSASKGTLRLTDLPSGQCLRELKGHSDGIYCAAFKPKLTPRRRGSALDIHHTSNGHAASLQLRALRVSVDRPSGPEIRAPRR